MARQQEVDELFDIKNSFYIGNYQQCINEAQKLRKPSSPEVAIERDIFTYRAYMSQHKFLIVMEEIKPTAHERLQPLKTLAEYLYKKDKRESIIAELDKALAGNVSTDNETLILVASTIYTNEGNFESAYRTLHACESLESMAFQVDLMLRINRLDMAKKKLKEMQDKDDDATLTQLAQAWVNIATGGDKLQEAYYIYLELADKYGSTPLLLNGQAVAFLAQEKYEEAGVALQEALDKDPNYPDTLINHIALAAHSRKEPEMAIRYLTQLRESHSEHSYVKDLRDKESAFDAIAAQCKVSKPPGFQ